MKKIIILFAVIALLPMVSCKKYLEVNPTNVISISNYDDVKALMGAYIRSFTTTSYTLSNAAIPYRRDDNHMFFAIYADELDVDVLLNDAMGRNKRALYNASVNWDNTDYPANLWTDHFNAIGFLNTIIDELEGVEATAAEKDIVRCEAKVLRAWFLFKIQQYFSPYGKAELGIPFNFDSHAVGSYVSRRHTQAEVYATLTTELNEVLACATPPRGTYNIFYDKRIANALLAQIYIFKGGSAAGESSDYAHAVTHAKAALEGRGIMGIGEFEPFNRFESSDPGLFTDTPQAMITSLSYISNGMYAYMGTSYARRVRKEVYDNVYLADDIRREKYFALIGAASQPEEQKQYSIIKYFNVTPYGTTSTLALNFFQYADMHLIVAEAYARQNDATNARLWLDSFKKERYAGFTSYTGSNLVEEVMLERRREFLLDYDMRWIDLIRDNRAWTRASSGLDPNVTEVSIKVGDYRYCMPIPVTQELANSNIDQNPGWDM